MFPFAGMITVLLLRVSLGFSWLFFSEYVFFCNYLRKLCSYLEDVCPVLKDVAM